MNTNFEPTQDQINAMNSGITSVKRQQYDNYANNKQNSLTAAQLAVLDSGITNQTIPNLVQTINTQGTLLLEFAGQLEAAKARITRLEEILTTQGTPIEGE